MRWYADETLTLYEGHAARVLSTMEAGSVDCVVTSPPYYGLRDYGGQPEQIGLEATPAEYVAALARVFAEVHRVLAADGTMWLNLGDSYNSTSRESSVGSRTGRTAKVGATAGHRQGRTYTASLPTKNLLGMPWRVAFALQDAGWYLRNAIVWHKPNAMPESVRDRLSKAYELIFLLTRSPRYWFDVDVVRVAATGRGAGAATHTYGERAGMGPSAAARRFGGNPTSTLNESRDERRLTDVWSLSAAGYPGAHFATFPLDLPRRCILAGCKPGGTVLDPFAGSGTTLLAAQQLGRRAIGIDLHPDYLKMALRRCQDAPLFTDGEAR